MKEIRFIPVFFSILLASCSLLDVEPKTAWSSSNIPTELAHLNGLLYGGYNRMGNVLIPGFVTYGDERADVYYVNAAQQTTHDMIVHSQLNDGMSQANWRSFYEVVLQANLLILYTPQLYDEGKITVDEHNSILGQAYAMRAYAYFWLVRIWGGVPIVERPLMNSQDFERIPRNTEQEVLAFILGDLDAARKIIPSSATKRTIFNRTGVYAIRAHVHAWMKGADRDWLKVKLYCDSVLSNSNYSLVQLYAATNAAGETLTPSSNPMSSNPNSTFRTYISESQYVRMFNSMDGASTESIFELSFNDADGNINNTYDSYFSSSNTNPVFKVREELVSQDFLPNDFRLYASVTSLTSAKMNVNKMCVGYTRGSNRNLVLLRRADIMLLRAEANIELAGSAPSPAQTDLIMADVNAILQRAGGPSFVIPQATYQTYTQDEFRTLVRVERKKELCFEGHRWFDIVRWGIAVEVLANMPEAANKDSYTFDTGPVTIPEKAILWPVHINEIRRSQGLIVQNEHYK